MSNANNPYGFGDNYDALSSHIMPAIIRKVYGAKKIVFWGSENPSCEFMHVDDCAAACIFLLKNFSQSQHVNVGTKREISIKAFVVLICKLQNLMVKLVLTGCIFVIAK
ncbi:NAD-dependent epimerase/dehydratase family protein [Bartonella sp. HY328]|uniref:NAD-dependent epimerase/dehydratase family protein n=1 Tax=unclassified Bartonella TaxID=2645622 RepID=UPI003965B817